MEHVIDDTVFALDIGTRTVIGAVCRKEGNALKVIAQSIMEHDSRSMIDGQVHDIARVSEVVTEVKRDLEAKVGFPLNEVAIAAAGRTLKTKSVHVEQHFDDDMDIDSVVINTLELSGVNEASKLVKAETGSIEDNFYCVGYSIVSYYLNGYPITNLLNHRGKNVGADVLATFLPQSVVNSLYRVLEKSSLVPISLTLEPIAALEAAVPENIRLLNIALVDIGAGTSDIAITSKGSITAYGMVSVAGDEVTEALAEEYIVDFNTAESLKRNVHKRKKLSFKDITGTKISVDAKDILHAMEGPSQRLAGEICDMVVSLNGSPPRALFCVGGGSRTPGLMDALSLKLKLDKQRIAVKDRGSIPNLDVCDHLVDGPEGVTVIGIAIVAFKKVGHDFINVYVNGKECRLFNSSHMTVCDVLGLIGYNPSSLIGRSGRTVRFKLNGRERRASGGPASPPEIYVNRESANLESTVKSGDFIDIKDAVDGRDASPILKDYMKGFQAVSCRINDYDIVIEPRCFINGSAADYTSKIADGDDAAVSLPCTIALQAERLSIGLENKYITANGKQVSPDYAICDGDVIAIQDIGPAEDRVQQDGDSITVVINGRNVVLSGKNHIFIDVFNYVDLDFVNSGGDIKLSLNGKKAEFSAPLKDGDIVFVGS